MELCEVHEQTYDANRYESCYMCYLERRPIYVDCIMCGRSHNARFAVCFACQQVPGREKAGKRLKLDIMGRDQFSCGGCGSSDGDVQVDHIRPIEHGGTTDPWNLRVICEDCKHAKRRNRTGAEHHRYRLRLVQAYQTYLRCYLTQDERQRVMLEPTEVDADEIDRALSEHRAARLPQEPVLTQGQRDRLELLQWRRPVLPQGR